MQYEYRSVPLFPKRNQEKKSAKQNVFPPDSTLIPLLGDVLMAGARKKIMMDLEEEWVMNGPLSTASTTTPVRKTLPMRTQR
jgi:hypothetical protein